MTTKMIIGTAFFMLLAVLTQYAECALRYHKTFGEPKDDTKQLQPIERAKTSEK